MILFTVSDQNMYSHVMLPADVDVCTHVDIPVVHVFIFCFIPSCAHFKLDCNFTGPDLQYANTDYQCITQAFHLDSHFILNSDL